MTLHETIISDSLSVFCNTDDFAETVVYNGSRSIGAVVIRDAWVTDG